MDSHPPDGPDVKSTTRRNFIVTGGAAATLALAGCSSGGSESTPTDDGQGGQTSTPTSSDGESTEGIDEWRAEMKEKAREELKGDEKLEIWGQSPPIEETKKLFNGEAIDEARILQDPPLIGDDDPWAPLKGNVDLVATGTQKQAEVYRRQVQTDSIQKDVLTTAYLPTLLKEDVPVMDIGDIPSWRKLVPDELQELTTKLGYFRSSGTSVVYNTETVSQTPETVADLVKEEFADDKIAIDVTPNATMPYMLLQEYGDEVPPWLESAGSSMTGTEFVSALGEQNLSLADSSYKMLLDTSSGQNDIAYGAPLTVVYDQMAEGAPIEPMKHPSGHFLRPQMTAISKDPPHPAAAKLFLDYLFSTPSVQLGEEGVLTMDLEKANPKDSIDWLTADWQRNIALMEIETSTKELRKEWRDVLDVPSV